MQQTWQKKLSIGLSQDMVRKILQNLGHIFFASYELFLYQTITDIISTFIIVSNITISYFDEASDTTTTHTAPIGKSVLDIALEHNLNIEGIFALYQYEYTSSNMLILILYAYILYYYTICVYTILLYYNVGACGGELACSTCHVKMTPEVFASLPEKEEEEEDMLDLAAGVTDW
jgi:hypothetical protein